MRLFAWLFHKLLLGYGCSQMCFNYFLKLWKVLFYCSVREYIWRSYRTEDVASTGIPIVMAYGQGYLKKLSKPRMSSFYFWCTALVDGNKPGVIWQVLLDNVMLFCVCFSQWWKLFDTNKCFWSSLVKHLPSKALTCLNTTFIGFFRQLRKKTMFVVIENKWSGGFFMCSCCSIFYSCDSFYSGTIKAWVLNSKICQKWVGEKKGSVQKFLIYD